MTTTAPASQSPDRMAQVHKANQPKSGQQTPATPADNFAALLMLADTEPTCEVGQPSSLETPDPTRPADDTDPPSSPAGQLALMGLLNWQNFSTATTGTSSSPGTRSTDAPTAMAVATTSANNPYTQTAGERSAPLASLAQGAPQPGTSTDAALLQPVDEALPAEMLAALRAASPDALGAATSQSSAPARTGVAIAPGEGQPGGKAKPGTLRHALGTGSATLAASSSAAPSTVSLAIRGMPVDSSSHATPPLSVSGKTVQPSDSPATGRDPTPGTDLVGTLVAGARPQEASAGAATPIFAAGMEAATTDITPTPPPDTPGMPTPETMEQTMEQLGAHIAYWATQGNQRASLTIGDSQNNPLGVNISFDNGEVHVHFETDEAEVQEALSLSAEEMLNRMLEARGLTLGDVSIGAGQGEQRSAPQGGANHPGDPQQGSDDSPRALAARADTPTRGNTGTGGSLGRPAGVISANKLDFFA